MRRCPHTRKYGRRSAAPAPPNEHALFAGDFCFFFCHVWSLAPPLAAASRLGAAGMITCLPPAVSAIRVLASCAAARDGRRVVVVASFPVAMAKPHLRRLRSCDSDQHLDHAAGRTGACVRVCEQSARPNVNCFAKPFRLAITAAAVSVHTSAFKGFTRECLRCENMALARCLLV